VRGLNEDALTVNVMGTVSISVSDRWANVGVGIGSTTANSAIVGSTSNGGAGYLTAMNATYVGNPGLGYRYAAALQRIRLADATYTFYGDNAGDQGFVTGIIGSVLA